MDETKIQWCDSTVNPIMGCAGCELFPTPGQVLDAIDAAVGKQASGWKSGRSKQFYRDLIHTTYDAIEQPKTGHRRAVTTTNLWHLREQFESAVSQSYGDAEADAARASIERQITCYAAKLHLNKGFSLLNPGKKVNAGYAPTFEAVTRYEGRMRKAAALEDLLGKTDPDRPWIDRLPRLIFVSDMGDALSRKSDFPYLKKEVIEPIESDAGRRHLWLWLTKRPELMAKLSEEVGGLPDNVCAMTTVTGRDGLDRIDQLRQVEAAVRGLSIEPLWERIPPGKIDLTGIDWLILGGESGSKVEYSRPFALEWVDELRDLCDRQGVAFFLKQLGRLPTREREWVKLKDKHGGDWTEWPDDVPRVREFPTYFHGYRREEFVEHAGFRRQKKGGLLPSEAKDFKRLDKVVGKFARDTIHAADALYEIRDRKLYRAKYKTFSDYCESVHQMSRQYANRLIKAGRIRAEMAPIVSKMGLPEPQNEAQLRELAKLKDAQSRVDIYREAVEEAQVEDRALTARTLADLVARRRGTEPSDSAKRPSPTQKLAVAREILDQLEEALQAGTGIEPFVRKLRDLLGDESRS